MLHRCGKLGWLSLLVVGASGCAGMAFSGGAPDIEQRLRVAADETEKPRVDPSRSPGSENDEPIDRSSGRHIAASNGSAPSLDQLSEAGSSGVDPLGVEEAALADGMSQLSPAAQARLLSAIREVRRSKSSAGSDAIAAADEEQSGEAPHAADAAEFPVAHSKSTTIRIRQQHDAESRRDRTMRRKQCDATRSDDALSQSEEIVQLPADDASRRASNAQATVHRSDDHSSRAERTARDPVSDRREAPSAIRPAMHVAPESAANSRSQHAASFTDDEQNRWEVHLERSISGLERETQSEPGSTAAVARHAVLRLLYLIDGRADLATRPIEGVAPTQADYWSKQLYALHILLDADRNPDARRRAGEAAIHLREAAAKLGELANLTIRNLTLCSEVKGFGNYKPLQKYEVHPGQRLLLYAEIDNFRSESNEDGYRTAVQGSYLLLDAQGDRVAAEEFAASEDLCFSPRRDLFVTYYVSLPTRLKTGTYTLQLVVEDAVADKLTNASLELVVGDR